MDGYYATGAEQSSSNVTNSFGSMIATLTRYKLSQISDSEQMSLRFGCEIEMTYLPQVLISALALLCRARSRIFGPIPIRLRSEGPDSAGARVALEANHLNPSNDLA